MTERTIRHLAVELAGEFYDVVRSAEKAGEKVHIRKASTGRAIQQIDPMAFGKTFPTVNDYLEGRKYGRIEHHKNGVVRWLECGYEHPDGKIYPWQPDTPGWMHWYAAARGQLVEMLNMPHLDERRKQQIMDALVEDREKQLKAEALNIKQPNITQRFQLRAD